MRNFRFRSGALPVLCLLLLFFAPDFSQALEIVPFTIRNQSPLVQIFGLPGAGEARILSAGNTSLSIVADLASHFTQSRRTDESIVLDGESHRIAAIMRSGLANGWELGAEIPYVGHGGGRLDGFIEDWHDLLGLPQGGRDQAPSHRLLYRYERHGVEKFRFEKSSGGLGDIRLTAGRQLHRQEWQDGNRAVSLRGSLKLPTGDSDRFLGSGSTDLALWATAEQEKKVTRGIVTGFSAAGLLVMTEGDILPEQQRNVVGFGTLGGGWTPWKRVALKVQVDGHTPFYGGSDLPEMGGSLQLTMGGTVALWPGGALDLAVTEDVVVHASPDAVFHLALRTNF
jgi:hypothetical protein